MSNAALRIRFVWSVCVAILAGALFLPAQEGGTGYLKVKANPGSAAVIVDGKYLGPAANFGFARKYPLPAGEHEVVLSDPRCQDFTTKVTIQAGKTATVAQSLQPVQLAPPPYGLLRVQGGSTKFDAVYLNGKFMGHIDEFNNFAQGLELSPGEYTLKVVTPAGVQELEQKITITANSTTKIQVNPSK